MFLYLTEMREKQCRYCIGVFAKASLMQMMQAARHKSVDNARRYILDSEAVLVTAEAEGLVTCQ